MSGTIGDGSQAVYGVVLAGGEGVRLQGYVRALSGTSLPKQYVAFTGRRSMLEHTFSRAERLVPARRLFTVIGRSHLRYPEVPRQLASRPPETVIVQPENRETGAGVLLPLVYLSERHGATVAAIFPSDHFVLEEDRFMACVEQAVEAVRDHPRRLVLLAVVPDEPETDYGYIVPGERSMGLRSAEIRKVSGFIEKPDRRTAAELMRSGALWNTMTMVCDIKALLSMVKRVQPALHRAFLRIARAIGTPHEAAVVEDVYRSLQPVNFSRGIMEPIAVRYPDFVSVLPVRGVCWSDWGSAERIARALDVLRRRETDLARAAASRRAGPDARLLAGCK
ncbi:MAG TPA: sugar phosphate nucleotidyltransferase [candidate division Zixibacteria bacterium]|nr:sugar phosphate nucleotidyltransferase [candidate division Zixibacteria bacterium]